MAVKGFVVENENPVLKIVGQDGNAFVILGKAKSVMHKAGWPEALQDEIMAEATSGDYDHLLGVMMKYFDVE